MAILNILHYPDPRLREKALPVEKVDSEVKQFISDMFETMYDAPGIGLAATQANVQKRIIVIDISEDSPSHCVLLIQRSWKVTVLRPWKKVVYLFLEFMRR